jgi:hypothetical protein
MLPRPSITAVRIKTAYHLLDRIWPPAGLAVGVGVTAVWISLLGYAAISLLKVVI